MSILRDLIEQDPEAFTPKTTSEFFHQQAQELKALINKPITLGHDNLPW